MSCMHGLRIIRASGWLVVLASLSTIGSSHAQEAGAEISAEKLVLAAQIYEELRKENPDLEPRAAADVARDLQAIADARKQRRSSQEAVSILSLQGSVTAAVQCDAGYVRQGKYSISDPNVTVTAENQRDCDARGCRAFEITAISESAEPFDLDVSVDCTG